MKVFALESEGWNDVEKRGLAKKAIVEALEHGLKTAAELLPSLSNHLNVVVRPHKYGIIPEYGVGAHTQDSEFIEVRLDKNVPFGAERTAKFLYATALHESNHAARWNVIKLDARLIEGVVFEGLATAFEREHANYQPLYGKYEDDETMHAWLQEILDAKDDWSRHDALYFANPDGRRWTAYKTGAWLVDRAAKKSGKTVAELTTLSADEILQLAGVE